MAEAAARPAVWKNMAGRETPASLRENCGHCRRRNWYGIIFELEMAIRADAETAVIMGRFDRMLTDTLLAMAFYRSLQWQVPWPGPRGGHGHASCRLG